MGGTGLPSRRTPAGAARVAVAHMQVRPQKGVTYHVGSNRAASATIPPTISFSSRNAELASDSS